MIKQLDRFLNKYIRFRPAIIYAYSCIDPLTGKRIWWAYIGQTRQLLVNRHNQHMGVAGYRGSKKKSQPWSDLYPQIRVVAEFKCPDILLDWVEEFYIKTKRPIYNDLHNRRNSRRIPIFLAQQQRKERDYLRRHFSRGRV